jgi:UDP-glucose 4-epimerase
MISWVIGRGGLLGRSVEQRMGDLGSTWAPTAPFNWNDQTEFEVGIDQSLDEFIEQVGSEKWSINWCAGIGVVSSSLEILNSEVKKIEFFLNRLSQSPSRFLHQGVLFYASSAGGVYAGSTVPPFTEATVPSPIGNYGLQKMQCEGLFSRFTQDFGTSSVLGRIANLYGPSQNWHKGQGVVTTICRSMLLRKPIEIFVPLETIRNYIYVDDAACDIANIVSYMSNQDFGGSLIKIIAAEHNSSISELLSESSRVFGKRPQIVLTRKKNSGVQIVDLRLRSTVEISAARFRYTTLAVGIDRIRRQLLSELQKGNLVDS